MIHSLSSSARSGARRIVIVGGGFTGVAYAIHLIGNSTCLLDICIIDPAPEPGRGIAYSTPDPAHRINVPSDRMSLYPGDPTHATRWMKAHGVLPDSASTDGMGDHYVARLHYGTYVAHTLAGVVAAASARVHLRHVQDQVIGIEPGDEADHRVLLCDGPVQQADVVALAFGHATPGMPCPVSAAALDHPGLIRNPWQHTALAGIAATASVLLIGTGLTMVDLLASLLSRGHAGPLTAMSRRGLLPQQHGNFGTLDFLQGKPAPVTARTLLGLARQRVRAHGVSDWHPVLDGLRAQLPVLWPALPPDEQQRAVRRLLPFWEIHRFRIGTQAHAVLAQAMACGQVKIHKAGIEAITLVQGQFACQMHIPGAASHTALFDNVIMCTGPEKKIASNRLVAALLANGTARLDAMGGGLAVDANSRVLGADGHVVSGLFAYGPITRGSFGEMTGAPDIVLHLVRQFMQRGRGHPCPAP